MKSSTLNLAGRALLIAAVLILAGCSSDRPAVSADNTTTAAYQTGVPGGVFVETRRITAEVTGVDAASRTVTLATSDGKKTTVKCSPEVINFDQIRVGDQLKVTATEQLAVYMASDAAPPGEGAAALVTLAPKGAKPGGVVAQAVQTTATVIAIDLKRHRATLAFSDGTSKTVAVRKDVDLRQRTVGERIVIRVTESLALSVERP